MCVRARSEGRCLPLSPLYAHTLLLGPGVGKQNRNPLPAAAVRRRSPPNAGRGRAAGEGAWGAGSGGLALPRLHLPAGRSRPGALPGLRVRESGLSPLRGPSKAGAHTGQLQPPPRCPSALLPAALVSRPPPGTAARTAAPAAVALPPAHTAPHPSGRAGALGLP